MAKYRDGAFIGSAWMAALRPAESLDLAFGVDDRIKVGYQKTKDEKANPAMLLGDTTVERVYRSKIKNLHKGSVTITVFDQIPVAQDADIKVKPNDALTTPGFVKDPEDRQGVILWKDDYKPQEDKTFDLAFTVKGPKDKLPDGF